MSFLYITHDIASARYVADRLIVMYAGHIVEEGPTEEVLQRRSTRTPSCCSPQCPTRKHPSPPLARPTRRAPESRRPERGLPLPAALPICDRRVRDGHPSAAHARRNAPHRLPRRPVRSASNTAYLPQRQQGQRIGQPGYVSGFCTPGPGNVSCMTPPDAESGVTYSVPLVPRERNNTQEEATIVPR